MTQETPELRGNLTVYLTDPNCASQTYLERMATFVASLHPFTWRRIFLNRCWLFEVADKDDETVALVWFSPVKDGVIELHACARPEWRGRWLTREVLSQLSFVLAHTNSRTVIVQIISPLIRRIVSTLGFTVHNRVATLHIQENTNG